MTTLETRRAALEARLTKGYAWFVAHGYEPTTATGVDAVDGDRKAEKAEAVWLAVLAEYQQVCDQLQAAQPEQAALFAATGRRDETEAGMASAIGATAASSDDEERTA